MIKKAIAVEDEEEKKQLVRMLAIMMKKDLNNWNKDGIEDQKIVDDLREYSDGLINLKVEDLHLSEPHRYYNNNNHLSYYNHFNSKKKRI